MSDGSVLLHADADAVAEALVARLLARIVELQSAGRVARLCLTGGRIATRAYQRLAAEGGNSAVDWSRVELWWGDERFVETGSEDRNAEPAIALLAPLGIPADRIHPMPATDGGAGLDDAAEAYDEELGTTRFDLCLLGLGPDGHVASLFPEHPSSYEPGRVIAVRSSPKPPPERISLTLEVINNAAEVWFLVSGADKAKAVALALLRTGPVQVPGAGARGRDRTLWLLDREAAAELPADLTQRGVF